MNAASTAQAGSRKQRSAAGTLQTLAGHGLRAQLRPMLVWGVILGLFNLMVVSLYPSLQQSSFDMTAYLQSFPPEVMAVFGIEGSMNTVQGFLAMESFNLFTPVLLSFFPILLGAYAVAGAEDQRRLDTLLANPFPRWQLIASSFLTMALGLLGALVLLGLFTWLPAAMLGVDLPIADVAAAVINVWPIGLFGGSLALLVSSLVRRSALAIAVAGAVLIAMYFLEALGGLSPALEPLQPVGVFHYYGSAIEDGLAWGNFARICGVALVLAALAVLAFRRRDIYT